MMLLLMTICLQRAQATTWNNFMETTTALASAVAWALCRIVPTTLFPLGPVTIHTTLQTQFMIPL
jgi:hypothetical protein